MGRGKKETLARKRFLFSPPPPPSNFFFCSRSNFRAITRLETLATQAMRRSQKSLLKYHLSDAVCVFFSITAGHGKSVERWTEEDSVHLSSFNNGDCFGISDDKLKYKFNLSLFQSFG